MKNRWAFISILFVTALFAGGALAGSVSLSVDDDTDKEKIKDRVVSGNTTTTRSGVKETCTLEIEVVNKAEAAATYTLEWYFISTYTSASERRGKAVIFKSGVKELAMEPGAKATEVVEAPPFVFEKKTVDRESTSGGDGSSNQTVSGDEYETYVVLVKEGGEIIASESGSGRYLKDEWMAKYKPGAGK